MITVELMSGDLYTFPFYKGYCVSKLKSDLDKKLELGDPERLFLFIDNVDNVDNKEINDDELIKENSIFKVFIKDPPTIYFEYNDLLSKIEIFIDDKPIHPNKNILLPNRPLLIRVHPSMNTMNNNGYRQMINYFYEKWLKNYKFLCGIWPEDITEPFVLHYTSLLRNSNFDYYDDFRNDYYNNYYNDHNQSKFKPEDIDKLLKLSSEYHLNVFISEFLSIKKSLNILKFEFL